MTAEDKEDGREKKRKNRGGLMRMLFMWGGGQNKAHDQNKAATNQNQNVLPAAGLR